MKSCLKTLLLVIGLLTLAGCQPQEGSESAARHYFEAEMGKWMADQESEAKPSMFDFLPPISYTIQSVVPTKPDMFATDKQEAPDNWEEWPAYQLNVSLQLVTVGNSSKEHVQRYQLTWNALEKRWFFKRYFE